MPSIPAYYDNTRLSDFKDCPRKFYFRHIAHLVSEGTAPALVFGLSWHNAMDELWIKAQDDTLTNYEVTAASLKEFQKEWQLWGYPLPEDVDEQWDTELRFRNIDTAIEMLNNYTNQYRGRIREFEIMAVEQPFAVPLHETDDSVMYVGRLDKVYKWRGQTWVGEHKTSSLYAKATIFRKEFIEGFDPNSQVDGYIHAGHMFWPDENFTGVMVDAALVNGSHHDGFKQIPVIKKNLMLDDWLGDVKYWIDQVEQHKFLLQGRAGDRNSPIRPFPRNTNQCIGKYGICTYHNICKYHPEPLDKTEFAGFRTEKWEPFSILKLAGIGLQEEQD